MRKTAVLAVLALILSVSLACAETLDMKWIKYGTKMYKAGQYEKAILAYEKAIEVNPDNSYAYQYMGYAYLQLKDNVTADEDFQRAYDILPTPALKKQIDALDEKVFGEGKFMLYPITFEVFGGMGMDLGTLSYSYGFSNMLRYGGMVSYHVCSWFAVKSGLIVGWGVDVPVLARFSYRLPWNNRTIVGIGAGPYINFAAPVNSGSDMGVIFAVDAHYVIGPVSLVATQMIQYGLANTPRLAEISVVGLAF